MQGSLKPGPAGVQRGVRFQITGRDVVQNDDILASFLVAERQFARDRPLEQFRRSPAIWSISDIMFAKRPSYDCRFGYRAGRYRGLHYS